MMRHRWLLILVAAGCYFLSAGVSHAKKPAFIREPAHIVSTSYNLVGMRDIELVWGEEHIWLSEIFREWGPKGTAWLWKKLDREEKLKLVESFQDDIEGRKYYFNKQISNEMYEILRKSVNWNPLKKSDLALWIPVKSSAALTVAHQFKHLPDVVNEVNITGIPLYKEYTHFLALFNQDAAGLEEIAYRIARIKFINESPTMKEASETTISVIVESMREHYITAPHSKDFSPLAQTAIKYAHDVLKTIADDPAFKTYDRNSRRLLHYYTKVMHEEIKTINRFLKRLTIIKKQIRQKAEEFAEIIDSQTSAMNDYRDEAKLLRDNFIEIGAQYRAQELSGQLTLSPHLHEIKEKYNAIQLNAEKLHTRSIKEVETVLAPGDPGSARRLLKKLRIPLDEIYEYGKEIMIEFEILSQAGGEIQLLLQELELIAWKLDILQKKCATYYEFFHRGILLGSLPKFDAGDVSSPLVGRPSLPQQARPLAYSFQQVLIIVEQYSILESLFLSLSSIIDKYPEEDLSTSAQRNSLNDARYLIRKIKIDYVDSRYFNSKLSGMREDLDLYCIDESDLLDMAQGRSPGIEPAFIETIEGQGLVGVRP